MIERDHIKKLADLSRIKLEEEELPGIARDIESILSYVEQIKEVTDKTEVAPGLVRNVMREDALPHEGGAYTEKLLHEAPSSKNGFIRVRKIIDQG